MVEFTTGNLLKADAEALVNTVNCVGVMGKGIALQFKQAFPENFRVYERACKAGNVQPGHMLVVPTGELLGPYFIIIFPTNRHWRGKSQLKDIKLGLKALVDEVRKLGIRSIAVPPLGCGNGGLEWSIIRPLIEQSFAELPDVRTLVYQPAGAPPADEMLVRTERPNMTKSRALFVKLIEQYGQLDYRCTLLEVQKLAYFLQEAGEPLKLQYNAAHYGPYAQNLNKVLERIEGHFVRGYGDTQKPDVEIRLIPEAISEADSFLKGAPDARERLAKVSELIQGFETPYGMELLASVHWVAWHRTPRTLDVADAIHAVRDWTKRKASLFQASHIEIAWGQLAQTGWLPPEEARPS